jgi:glycosyltransferase involved in cell wall biosynthesis
MTEKKKREFFGIPEDDFVIGTVAYFTREKNFPLVLKLAKSLHGLKQNISVLCIGDLNARDKKKADTIENLITPGIIQTPVDYYNTFNMYVSTSTREGLGSALLDAVVRDIPSIALDSGGSRDIFPKECPYLIDIDNQDIFVESVHDAIKNYHVIVDFAKALGIQAREKFSVSNLVQKHIELYNAIVIADQ